MAESLQGDRVVVVRARPHAARDVPAPRRSRMRVTERLDGYQRRHRWAGFPVAVIYKFFEDQGPYLAALITFYGFLSLFPLLLLLASVLGFVLQGNPDLQQRILDSALSQFPVIGDQLSDPQGLQGSGAAVVIGGLVALYGALGVAQALQNAMNVAWSVPRNRRPNPVKARLRSLLLIGTAGIAVLATTILSALGGSAGADGALVHRMGRTARDVRRSGRQRGRLHRRLPPLHRHQAQRARRRPRCHHRRHHLAAAAGVRDGVRRERRQGRGHHLRGVRRGARPARVDLPGGPRRRAERRDQRRAHQAPVPTALLTPFTDNVDLTRADRRAYTDAATAQRHKGFESVDVTFDNEGQEASARKRADNEVRTNGSEVVRDENG